MASTPGLRPLPPLAKRLNRNALTVAAVLMGMTVLTAVVVVRPSRGPEEKPAAASAGDEAPPVPSRPAFLDEPVRVSPPRPDTMPGAAVVPPGVDPGRGGPPSLADTAAPYAASAANSSGASARERAYGAAVRSAAVLREPDAPPSPTVRRDSDPLAVEEQQLVSLSDSVLRASTRGGVGGAAAPPVASPPRDGRHRAFLDTAGDARGGTVPARLEPAGSPYTLRAGTVIPGLLVTGINSDLPGDLVGQVGRDVYDSRTQRICLIPKGARFIGTYDNQIAAGEGRLLVAWTRLILPDGRSLKLLGSRGDAWQRDDAVWRTAGPPTARPAGGPAAPRRLGARPGVRACRGHAVRGVALRVSPEPRGTAPRRVGPHHAMAPRHSPARR